jgi:hypothetical protein
MRAWILVATTAACTTAQQKDVGSTVITAAVGTTCPSGSDALPAIAREEVGGSVETGANSSCSIDEVLSVGDPAMHGMVTSCCYAVTCTASVSAADGVTQFDASCEPVACAELDLTAFSPARVRAALAADLPACVLADGTTTPSDVQAASCWYVVDERETCYSGGLGS